MDFQQESEFAEGKYIVQPASGRPEATSNTIHSVETKRGANFLVYGLLLTVEADDPLAHAVSTHWSQIHNLTGDRFLLVAFQTPSTWTESDKAYWRQALGATFDQKWQEWQQGIDEGVAYKYLEYFQPSITPSHLPCLVLFTDLNKRNALVLPFTQKHWSEDEQFALLKDICGRVRATCFQEDFTRRNPDDRLEFLRDTLTSPTARLKIDVHNLAKKTIDYLYAHPVQSVSLALTCGTILVRVANAVLPFAASSAIIEALESITKSLNA